jgi:hyaluronoglucosaminidase
MKLVRYWVLAAAVLGLNIVSARADWNSTISSANPLNWYSFNETQGTTANDQGSGGANGTYTGAVGLGASGLVGSAASFDGTSSVLVGAANLTSDWTVEAIFKADTATGGPSMGLIGADFAAANPRMAIKAEQWESTEKLGYTSFGVVDVTFADAAAVTPTDYAHVAFVGTSAGVELFINGASLGSDPTATVLSRHVLGAGAVRADGTLVDGLVGAIDELVIYDRALSAGEVSEHYASVPEPGTITLLSLGLLAICHLRRSR